ncbi:MAG: VWA domain-containing protein [Gemmatimonadota bacterium]|nr:VWA domain-containing protein [Gemmatimonadota bacterium]
MKTTATVSTTFAATHDRHRVGLLVSLTGDQPVNRPPVNVALVLDRSGSMGGEPMVEARKAALRFASFLGANDQLTVVAFSHEVQLLYGPGPGNSPEAAAAINRISEGGNTNLSGGWLEGHRHLSRALLQGVNRILLLTDGQANAGVTDIPALRLLSAGAVEGKVSTTCIGFGPHFNEDLLTAMAEGGGGHFWYVEHADQMTGSFEGEIEGLVSLAAQNVSVEVTLTHPGVAGVSLAPELPCERTAEGVWRIRLGDLYAVQPRSVGLIFHVENAGDLGEVELGRLVVHADILGSAGVEHRTITLPVMASLDSQDHVVPEVETAFLRFAVAKARDEAIRHADDGDLQRAGQVLEEAACHIPADVVDPGLRDARQDLLAESARLKENYYFAADRKYHMARSAYSKEGRQLDEAKLSRRKRQPKD